MPRTRPDQLPDGVRRIVDRGELADALATADALVLACPYTPETHHLIQTAQFAALKRGAMLINIARGPVVDEGALVEALRRGQVGGAVLDVFEREPLPADSPLWDMPNVLVSPHSASTVHEESELIVDLFIDNLRRFLSGAPLRNVFDARRGY